MRQSQCFCCTDVTVFCSTQCWTDHKLLCAALKYDPVVGQTSFSSRRRFNVALLGDEGFVSRFTDHVVHIDGVVLPMAWHSGLSLRSVSCRWPVSCYIGWNSRRQPNWFITAVNTLRPLIDT